MNLGYCSCNYADQMHALFMNTLKCYSIACIKAYIRSCKLWRIEGASFTFLVINVCIYFLNYSKSVGYVNLHIPMLKMSVFVWCSSMRFITYMEYIYLILFNGLRCSQNMMSCVGVFTLLYIVIIKCKNLYMKSKAFCSYVLHLYFFCCFFIHSLPNHVYLTYFHMSANYYWVSA